MFSFFGAKARLTNLVVEAETQDELPPLAVSPSLFGGRSRGPTLEELKAATALCRVCRGLDVGLTSKTGLGFFFETDEGESGPEDREFETRVVKTSLKLLICGAALAGVYNEPLFQARSSGDPELKRLVDSPGDYRDLSHRQLEFLERFAVCNMQATPEAEEAVFGPLGDWLLSSILSDSEARAEMAKLVEQGHGPARYCQQQSRESPCPVKLAAGENTSHSDAHLVVWEVMKMILVYEHLGGLVSPRRYVRALFEIDQGPLQKAIAVFPGVFRAERLTPVERISGSQSEIFMRDFVIPHDHDYFIHGVFDRTSDLVFWEAGVSGFFSWIHRKSGRPNVIEETGYPTAPLRLKFFEYFLRRRCGLRFIDDAFYQGEYGSQYHNFVNDIGIFGGDAAVKESWRIESTGIYFDFFTDGSGMLTGFEPAPARIYQDRDLG